MKNEILMVSITRYFDQNPDHFARLKSILDGKSISVRQIEYFITHYCPGHNVYHQFTNKLAPTSVYHEYRVQLKAYGKNSFDPFRRQSRITYDSETNGSIETTVSQLNFFRWLIENGILDYIEQNIKAVTDEMATAVKKRRKLNTTKQSSEEVATGRSRRHTPKVRDIKIQSLPITTIQF